MAHWRPVRSPRNAASEEELRHLAFTGALAGICLAWSAGPALADNYNITKTVKWEVTSGTKFAPYDAMGHYQSFYHVFAKDAHGSTDPSHRDNENQVGREVPQIKAAFDLDAAHAHTEPQRSYHLKYDMGANFGQLVGLDTAPIGAALTKWTHPQSSAYVEFDASVPYPDPDPTVQKYWIDGTIHVFGDASIKTPLGDKEEETTFADAASGGEMRLKGYWEKGQIVGAKSPPINVAVAVKSRLEAGAKSTSHQKRPEFWQDPLLLTVSDAVTGDVLAQDQLWSMGAEVNGAGSVIWDDSGFTILADTESSAGLSLATVSSWVLNPISGSVSFTDGQFDATGIFASLPWELSHDGDFNTAHLDPGVIDPAFLLDVQADGLGQPLHDLETTLTSGIDPYVEAYATIPAPVSALTLILASACTPRRR